MNVITRLSRLFVLVAQLLVLNVCGVVHADTHVLVRFDETGHYLHRVARTENSSVSLALSSTRSLSGNSPTDVWVHWFDQFGERLGTTTIADPRLTHAPLLHGSTDLAWTSHQEGAYSLTGPTGAVKIQVILPGWRTPYVPAETWVLEL